MGGKKSLTEIGQFLWLNECIFRGYINYWVYVYKKKLGQITSKRLDKHSILP